MKKHFGLRIMKYFYSALAWVTALSSVASIGVFLADAYFKDSSLDTQRIFLVLIGGGIVAISLYVLSQLIDILLETYRDVHIIAGKLQTANDIDKQTLELLQKHTRMLRALHGASKAEGEEEILVNAQRLLDTKV